MDNHGTLVVENVDLDLLEQQRLALACAVECTAKGIPFDRKKLWLLDGLRNMLDSWSDERHFAEKEVPDAGKA